jgi:hypothetical protein
VREVRSGRGEDTDVAHYRIVNNLAFSMRNLFSVLTLGELYILLYLEFCVFWIYLTLSLCWLLLCPLLVNGNPIIKSCFMFDIPIPKIQSVVSFDKFIIHEDERGMDKVLTS